MNKRQDNKNRPARVIGLTGGIASGKSEATAALAGAGYCVIDADEISRECFAAGTDGEKSMMRAFPQATKNGKLERRLLRKIISEDDFERQRLNELTHPVIIAEIKRRIGHATPPVILSAPLLFETSLSSLCDVTVCVYCPKTVRIQRLMLRDGVTKEDAQSIVDAQLSDALRCTLADRVVSSDRSKPEFISEIIELVKSL